MAKVTTHKDHFWVVNALPHVESEAEGYSFISN